MKLHELLEKNAKVFPSKTFLYSRSSSVTYGEAWEQVRKASAGFQSLGVKLGDRVEFFANDSIEYLLAMFAVFKCGGIASFIDVNDFQNFNKYTEKIDPRVVVFEKKVEEHVKLLAAAGKELISIDGPAMGARTWTELLELSSAPNTEVDFDDRAPCHLSFTSGTTYEPKPAVLSHESTVTSTRMISERLELDSEDVTLSITPYSNSHVFVYGLLPQMHKKSTTGFVGGGWDPEKSVEQSWSLIREKSVTFISGHTYRLRPMADYGLQRNMKPGTLRKVLCGGGPAYQGLRAKWEGMGVTFLETYGMSECGGALAETPPHKFEVGKRVNYPTIHTSGPILPDKEVKIVNEDDTEVSVGQPGEIAFRGGYMWGYWKMSKETTDKTRGGWLHTGDIGCIDEFDNLYWLGRKTDLIRRDGKVLFPRVVEEALYLHPDVAQVAVLGIDDQTSGQVPYAFVVPYPGKMPSEETLLGLCRETLAEDYIPRKIVIRSDFPLTPNGKIEKKSLKQFVHA